MRNPSFDTVLVLREEFGKPVQRYLYYDRDFYWNFDYNGVTNTVVVGGYEKGYHARARVLCRYGTGHLWVIMENWRKKHAKPEVFLKGLPTWEEEVRTYGEDWLLGHEL
jgi:hypothetical protein